MVCDPDVCQMIICQRRDVCQKSILSVLELVGRQGQVGR